MISRELIHSILMHYPLPSGGIHGISHWARVLENGRRLSVMTGAKVHVVELFAVFHDSQRMNEGFDDGHGYRGAMLARILHGLHYKLDDRDLDLLIQACELHTDGYLEGDVTVQTCWDADRLDLGRVGIIPQKDKLCTASAKKPALLKWAITRSEEFSVPTFVSSEWGIQL